MSLILSNTAIQINIKLPWALWLQPEQFPVFHSHLKLFALNIIWVWLNGQITAIQSWTQPYYFHCLSSARSAETVAVKLSLWNSSKQMLEVIDFFSQKHFERLSKIVTQKGISCGRKGLCVLAPDCVCVFGVCLCGQAAWEFWYTAVDRCQKGTARQPSSAGQNSPVQRHGAQPSPQTLRFWLGFLRAQPYSSLFLSLSFSFQPLRPNKRPTTLKTNTLLNLIWIYLFAYGYLGGCEMYPNWLTFHLNQNNEMGWCGVVVKAPGGGNWKIAGSIPPFTSKGTVPELSFRLLKWICFL